MGRGLAEHREGCFLLFARPSLLIQPFLREARSWVQMTLGRKVGVRVAMRQPPVAMWWEAQDQVLSRA